MNMNANSTVAIIAVSFFSLIAIGIFSEKDEHQKRMNLIEEQLSLVRLRNNIQLEKDIRFTDSLIVVIKSELNQK